MVMFIFTMFGIQMYRAWGDWNDMGRVFWTIILITTIVGVTLSFIYAPRTWCSFCPMGSLSAWVTPRSGRLPNNYRRILVGEKCTTRCKLCSAVCPMQLKPYESRNDEEGFALSIRRTKNKVSYLDRFFMFKFLYIMSILRNFFTSFLNKDYIEYMKNSRIKDNDS